jgi:hypothetical protein
MLVPLGHASPFECGNLFRRQIFAHQGAAIAALQAVIFLDGNKHEPFAPVLGPQNIMLDG